MRSTFRYLKKFKASSDAQKTYFKRFESFKASTVSRVRGQGFVYVQVLITTCLVSADSVLYKNRSVTSLGSVRQRYNKAG
jgi:hypothetical protein